MPQRGGQQARPYLPGTRKRVPCTFAIPAAASVYTALIEDPALVASLCAGIRSPIKAAKARDALRDALRPLAAVLGFGAPGISGTPVAEVESPAADAGARWQSVAAAYLAHARLTARSQRTPERYESDLRRAGKAIAAVIGTADPAITGFRPSHFASIQNWLLTEAPLRYANGKLTGKKGYAASTTRQVMKVLAFVLDYAHRDDLIAQNPWHKVKMRDRSLYAGSATREESAAAKNPFTEREAASMLEAVTEPGDAVWTLMLLCGLRVGEALGLRWSDIDRTSGRVHLRWQVPKGRATQGPARSEGVGWLPVALDNGRVCVLTPPKHGSARVLYLPRRCLDRINALPVPIRGDGFVFSGRGGAPTARSTLAGRFKRFQGRAGIDPPHRLKDLRDTATNLMVAAGIQERVISAILGHSTATMEQMLGLPRSSPVTSTYGGRSEDLLQGAARAMDALDIDRRGRSDRRCSR